MLVDAPNLRIDLWVRIDEHSKPSQHSIFTRNGEIEAQLNAICHSLEVPAAEYKLINWEIHHDA